MKLTLPTIPQKDPLSTQDPPNLLKKPYDYFSTRIPRSQIEPKLKHIKDERFLFFLKYGALRRFDGDYEIIYVEIPQIPNKLVVYRVPYARMKSLDKFNLSKKDLPHIPLFEGEENLQYLSLEINQITKLDQLISLNNLIYLNLYCNKINEIENLQNLTKLKVLLLGKNNIVKIKNLQHLHELEILDLHSNKIKIIENLILLKKLRILNLANNQIVSMNELIFNKYLEELNIRKNLIMLIPNLNGSWDKMKKLNIGKNQIGKIESLIELIKLKNLTEVIIEDNPVMLLKESISYLQQLPIYIINSNKSKQNISSPIHNNPITINSIQCNNINNTVSLHKSQSYKITKRSNNISSTFSTYANSTSVRTSSNISNSNEYLLQLTKPIKSKWEDELKRIHSLGYNGYINKRYKEHNLTNGHVELENDNKLIIYGDALKVLQYEEFQNKINCICFYYFYYDFILCKKNLELLQQFKKLNSIYFSDNNIFSYYQIIKLENIENLENVSIYNNEINTSVYLKYFLIYRIQNLKMFNGKEITNEDIGNAKMLFEYFDKCISCNEKYREDNRKKEWKEKSKLKEKEQMNWRFYEYVKTNLSVAVKEIVEDMFNQEWE